MKLLLIITLLSTAAAFGVIREDDPSYTPEQRQRARETNERMRQRNEERMIEKEKQFETLAQKYKNAVEKAKKRLKGNVEFQKEFVMAAGEFGMALAAQAEHAFDSSLDYTKKIEQLSFDYFAPVLAKYDTEVKKYLDEVNAIKAKYQPIVG